MCDREVDKRAWLPAVFCCCQPFLEASSPRDLLEGRRQLERARGRHRCLRLVKPSWRPACKQQENPGPCEQDTQMQISVMPLSPPFLKGTWEENLKKLWTFSHIPVVWKGVLSLGNYAELKSVPVRESNAKACASRGSLWQISLLQKHTWQLFLISAMWQWTEEQFSVLQCCARDKQHLWAQKLYQTCLEFT